MKRTWVAAGVTVIALVVVAVWISSRQEKSAEPSGRPLPRSMAAIGDSITQALAVTADAFGAAPQHSWATGADNADPIDSHYERLIAAGALQQGNVYNNSFPGARMADAVSQAASTVSQKVDYVVVLIGANDVCAPDTTSMTTTASFRSSFEEMMRTLTSGLPQASIYVVSIPDVNRLWEVARDDLAAQTVWDAVGVCRSVLARNLSDTDRAAARERNAEFNSILSDVCGRYPSCRSDQNAVFGYEFDEDEIGPLDHFHPSLEGQAALADISWANGFWPEL